MDCPKTFTVSLISFYLLVGNEQFGGIYSFCKCCGFFQLFIVIFFPYGLLCFHAILLCLLNHSLCGFMTFLTSTNIYFPILNGNVAPWVFVPSSTLKELLPVRVPASCSLLMVLKLCFKACGVLFWRSCCEPCDICCITRNFGKLLWAILWFLSLFWQNGALNIGLSLVKMIFQRVLSVKHSFTGSIESK